MDLALSHGFKAVLHLLHELLDELVEDVALRCDAVGQFLVVLLVGGYFVIDGFRHLRNVLVESLERALGFLVFERLNQGRILLRETQLREDGREEGKHQAINGCRKSRNQVRYNLFQVKGVMRRSRCFCNSHPNLGQRYCCIGGYAGKRLADGPKSPQDT